MSIRIDTRAHDRLAWKREHATRKVQLHLGLELVNQTLDWLELLGVDEIVTLNKVDEVLEARVQVRLGANLLTSLKVTVVNVPIQAHEAAENVRHDLFEVARKLCAVVDWEQRRIADLLLDPREHELDVLERRHLGGLLAQASAKCRIDEWHEK